jgi:hypothetical protein
MNTTTVAGLNLRNEHAHLAASAKAVSRRRGIPF